MDKDVEKLKKLMNVRKKVSKTGSCIIWNMEKSGKMHRDDYCTDFHFFVKYKNPETILDKIDKIFDERDFTSPIDKHEHSRGHIEGTVNDYILITYTTSIAPQKMYFDWTTIPVRFDKNLSRDHKKGGSLEEYISKFINN